MRTKLITVVGGMAFLSNVLPAQQEQSRSDHPVVMRETLEAQLAWRKALVEKKVPTRGCFKVVYPSKEWVPTSCIQLPANLKQPSSRSKARVGRPEPPAGTGGSVDFVAQATKGTIVSATGSFPFVSTTGEINVTGDGKTTSRNNQFSLQLNSNVFNSDVCKGSKTGQCQGWEQFVLSNDPGSPPGFLWIQFWLLDYGTPCPQGWGASGSDCFYNGKGASPQIIASVQTLQSVWLEGIVETGGRDTVLLGWTDGVAQAIAFSADSVLDLAAHWTQSEFNVFGDLTFHQARFNPGTSIVVSQALTFANDTVTSPLTFNTDGTTGETNNLNLVRPPCVEGPTLSFMESNVPGATHACPNFCAMAKELVAQDQAQLTKLQNERNDPMCAGPAVFECSQAVRALATKLANDIALEKKDCAH
jgi:hypothetical protein